MRSRSSTKSIYALGIIDPPAFGVVSEPISLVHQVDGVIVISRLGRSRRDHAVRLMKRLRGLNAHLLGVVVNGYQSAGKGYNGYYGDGGTPASGVRSPSRGLRGRQRDPSRTP